jgi:FMN-dependent NADH-azoreductase
MSRLLLVSSNLNGTGLKTRRLALRLIESLRRADPAIRVAERNLYADPIPSLPHGTFAASLSELRPNESQLRARSRSDLLIAEVEAADIVVIAAPMQNFSVPSTLKAWIDHVARAGRTFRFTPDGRAGLLTGKRVFVVTARSAYFADGLMSAHDHHEPYLRAVLRALGMEDVSFLYVEDQEQAPVLAGPKTRDAKRAPVWEAAAA